MFRRFGMAIARFMQGRYGMDSLGFVVAGLYLFCSLLMNFVRSLWLYLPMGLLLAVFLYRALSRNLVARRKEKEWFSRKTHSIALFFKRLTRRVREYKTHLYFKCPACHNTLRVPRGKGSITVTCPVCREQIKKKT